MKIVVYVRKWCGVGQGCFRWGEGCQGKSFWGGGSWIDIWMVRRSQLCEIWWKIFQVEGKACANAPRLEWYLLQPSLPFSHFSSLVNSRINVSFQVYSRINSRVNKSVLMILTHCDLVSVFTACLKLFSCFLEIVPLMITNVILGVTVIWE